MTQNDYDVIVVGAGHNGLTAAGYLARDGFKVLVVERLDKVGGACTTDEIFPGFSGPMCAYICHMLQGKVIDDLRLRDHGFEIINIGSGSRESRMGIHPFPDGSYLGGLGVPRPMDMAEQIRDFSPHDARGFLEWESFWEQAAAILYADFLAEPPTLAEVVGRVRGTRQEDVLEKMLTWSTMDLVGQHFEDPRVRAHFLGTPERDTTAVGSIMSQAYFRTNMFVRPEDVGIPRGGMGSITTAMARSAESFGAEIRTGAPVERIIVEAGAARGVRLAGGEEIRSFIVVSNADVKRTFLSLVDPSDLDPTFLRRIGRVKTQMSSLKFLAAISELPDLSRFLGQGYDPNGVISIMVSPSVEYHHQSWRDARSGRPSSCPMSSIQIPSLLDPSLAPRGGHMLSAWVLYASPHLKSGPWDDVRQEVGEGIIDSITEYAPNFRDSLIDWTLQTPEDMELRVGLTDGNIRHTDLIPQQLLSLRQSYRTPIRNFYLCGSGTHPGGEVTAAPGHNAAHAIMRDLQKVVS